MLSKYIASIFLVLLIIVSSIPVSAQFFGTPYGDTYSRNTRYGIGEESIGVWGVDIEQQSPLVVPAVALEHRSRAPVLLKVKFYPLTVLGGENLIIKNVYVQQVETQRGVNTVKYEELNKEENTGIVYVLLDRIGVGRDKTPKFDENDVEKACRDASGKGIIDNVPDELNLSLRAIIRFEAKRPDGTNLDRRDFVGGSVAYTEDEIDRRINEKLDYDLRREQSSGGRYTAKSYDVIRKEVEREFQGRVQEIITDVVYFDTVIPIDKTRVYNPSPEKLRERICGTIKLREKMAGIINTVEKVETYMTVGCLGSMIGSAVGVLFGMNYCDAVDTISLGCDWVFCPKSKCAGEVDPFNSIVASSALCWDTNRKFFGKGMEVKKVNDIPVEPTEYTGKCEEDTGSITIPTYGCVSGVRGNLQIIDLMIKKYQDCLVAAKTGGVSVGICDRLRNAFICDRAVGVVLDIFNGKSGSTYFRGIFNKVGAVEGEISDGAGDASKTFKERVDTLSALSRNTVEEYERVPFFKMFAQKQDYLRGRICSTLIEGGLFNIKDLKNNLLRVPIPDSYFVLTERREWGDISEESEAEESFGEKSYSYDVFYQIYSGEGNYQRGGNYNIYLRGLRNSKTCRVSIASGFVPSGEMVQENVFRVDACNAEEQCIIFKNKENCNGINEFAALTNEGVGADPFGLSLLFIDDSDNDGLPDTWENKYDISDPSEDNDGDKYCNAVEFESGTDPKNKDSHPEDETLKQPTQCESTINLLKKEMKTGYSESNENVNPTQQQEQEEVGETEGEAKILSISSIKIKKDTTIIDDYNDNKLEINDGGEYTLEFIFDQDIKECNIVDSNFEHTAATYTPLQYEPSDNCKFEVSKFVGEDTYTFTIKADAKDTDYGSFEKRYEITNNELKVEDKSLLCEVTADLPNGGTYGYCLYPSSDKGERCSSYNIILNPWYGIYKETINTELGCNNKCVSDYGSNNCLSSDGNKMNDNILEEVE